MRRVSHTAVPTQFWGDDDMRRRQGEPVPGEGEVFGRPEIETDLPRHMEDLTPNEDLASLGEHPPELRTEPLEGRVAGTRAADVEGATPPPMTTRNISGEGA